VHTVTRSKVLHSFTSSDTMTSSASFSRLTLEAIESVSSAFRLLFTGSVGLGDVSPSTVRSPKATMTHVMLSQPVPSPLVSGDIQ